MIDCFIHLFIIWLCAGGRVDLQGCARRPPLLPLQRGGDEGGQRDRGRRRRHRQQIQGGQRTGTKQDQNLGFTAIFLSLYVQPTKKS